MYAESRITKVTDHLVLSILLVSSPPRFLASSLPRFLASSLPRFFASSSFPWFLNSSRPFPLTFSIFFPLGFTAPSHLLSFAPQHFAPSGSLDSPFSHFRDFCPWLPCSLASPSFRSPSPTLHLSRLLPLLHYSITLLASWMCFVCTFSLKQSLITEILFQEF